MASPTPFTLELMSVMPSLYSFAVGVLFILFSALFVKRIIVSYQNLSNCRLPPAVPGLPIIGNLLQLKEKKPHKTFTKWAEIYGPIYSIRTGASTVIAFNSAEAAKEATVTKFSSISTRKQSNALTKLTHDKTMVATSDYNDFHKMVKRYILGNVLGASAQRQHRVHRDTMMENISNKLHAHVMSFPLQDLNFRKIFEAELFGIALEQALGSDVNSIYVDDLGKTLSRDEMFNIVMIDLMKVAIEVDWRDFFPYLKWIPNSIFERKIQQTCLRREAVMNALISNQKKRIALQEEKNCYLDFLLSEAKNLRDDQLMMLLWEAIIETSDTTLVTTEWAIYELAKDPRRQTLRKYSPVPVVPLRYAHEDTKLGGCHIPAGSEIAINIYGCNMNKKQWEDPEEWNPERFLNGKYDPTDLYKTMAFGAGKRSCAGSLQAMSISCTSIGRLVQEFEWRLKDGKEADIDTLGLTTRKLQPLHAMIKPRN